MKFFKFGPSASAHTHTSEAQDTIMQKLNKPEQSIPSFPTQSTADTLPKGWDSADYSNNGFSKASLSNADLQWLLNTSQHLHQAETLESLLKTAVADVHQHFQADRVLIYWFQTDTQGVVVAESLVEGYTPSLNETLPAVAFGANSLQEAQHGSDVYGPSQ